jgi:hypothetical protein
LLDLDKQLINWIHIVGNTKVNLKTDAFDFWKSTSINNLLDLKNIALNILCTPSSTATVERVFSAAGNACIGRKNRLSEKRLEMIGIFKNNSKFLNTLNFLK